MIYRLDLARPTRGQPRRAEAAAPAASLQIVWTAIALVLFLAVLLVVRDHRVLPATRTRWPRRAGAPGPARPCCRRDLPRSTARRSGSGLGPVLHPAGRVREDRADGLLRRVPGAEARRAVPPPAAAFLGHGAAPRPATSARCWSPGAVRRRAGLREGPRHLAAVLRHRPGDDLHGDRAGVLADHRRCSASPAVPDRLPAVRPRAGAGGDLAGPVRRHDGRRLPDRAVAVRARHRRDVRHRSRRRPAGDRAVRLHRLHHRRRSARNSAWSGWPRSC